MAAQSLPSLTAADLMTRPPVTIGPDETAGELGERLARIGADAVREWLPKFVAGACVLEPQDNAGATMAPMLDVSSDCRRTRPPPR